MTAKERGRKTEQAIERLLKRAQMARDMTVRNHESASSVANDDSENASKGWWWKGLLFLMALLAGYFVLAE